MSRGDRVVRDCQHPRSFHPHGTRNAYVRDRCRCGPCMKAGSAYSKHLSHAKATGRFGGLVDAEPVREHIRALSAAGVGLKTITRKSGVSGGVLTKLLYGNPRPDGTRRPPCRRCTPSVRDRILSVTADDLAGGAFIDGAGTRRRLQALVAVGWSQSKLAVNLGMAVSNFSKTIRAERVTVTTAKNARNLYDHLWDTPPPQATHRDRIAYSRARNVARAAGWLPPLAWDDDTIDDPTALPNIEADPADELDEIAVERIMSGTLRVAHFSRSAERKEAVRRLAQMGFTDAQISQRIGITSSGAQRLRTRTTRKDAA